MSERRSVLVEAPDRWLRLVTKPDAPGWEALSNGERLGWLQTDARSAAVHVWVDGIDLGRLGDDISRYYAPIITALSSAGIDAWARINVVAVEDRYVLHDYLREDALRRWAQHQLRT